MSAFPDVGDGSAPPRFDDPIIRFRPTFACQCPRALKVLVTATAVGRNGILYDVVVGPAGVVRGWRTLGRYSASAPAAGGGWVAESDPDDVVVAVFPRSMPIAEVTRRLRSELD